MIEILRQINDSWKWKGFQATKIELINDFGNVIFQTDNYEYWRICPEELSCEKIADSHNEYDKLINDSEFQLDWKMENLVRIAKDKFENISENEKYCLKKPAEIGGEYERENIGKITFKELISFSGDLGFQIKDLKNGEKIRLRID